MAFRDILKKQRQSGQGLISSIASASNKSMLESIDPRNKIFKKGSLLNSLFPNVKGYKAEADKPSASSMATMQAPVAVFAELSSKLDRVADKLDVVGKNTMVMPLMMRDSNIMRQSLVKLVKLSGGTQRDKADRFFQTSKDRESLYESQFKKSTSVTTPTPAVKKPESGGGFLDMLLKGLLFGGVLAGIGKLMDDPAIREIAKQYIQGFVTSVFNGLKFIIKTIMDTEIDVAGFKMSLGAAIAGTIAAFVGFKLAIAALGAYITSKIGGASIPSAGIPDTPDKGKPGGKTPPGAPGTAGKASKIAAAVIPFATTAAVPVAAAAAVATAVEIHDENKKEYLDLAKKKRDEGLTTEEESRIKQLSTISFRAAATQILNYDPITGKASEAKTSGQIAAQQRRDSIARSPEKVDLPPAPVGAQASVRAIDNATMPKTSPVKTTSSSPSKTYSDVVAKSESGGNYDTVYGKAGNATINGKLVTQNTIGEVIEWQNKMRSSNRHAAGKYQFINVADAAKNAGLSTSALFDGINQELMQNAFTERNAKTLRQSGIEPTNENLGLAHSVGATGASKLLQAQQSGQGNLLAADVLGLKGSARDTNPHLMKPVSHVIASNESRFNGLSPSVAPQPPTTMVAQAPATPVPAAPVRPATQIASASSSLADSFRSQMQTPVVINAPTTNNNVRNGGGGQRSTTTPSIVDSELMKLLVERVAA